MCSVLAGVMVLGTPTVEPLSVTSVSSVAIMSPLLDNARYNRRLHPGRQRHWMICSPSV